MYIDGVGSKPAESTLYMYMTWLFCCRHHRCAWRGCDGGIWLLPVCFMTVFPIIVPVHRHRHAISCINELWANIFSYCLNIRCQWANSIYMISEVLMLDLHLNALRECMRNYYSSFLQVLWKAKHVLCRITSLPCSAMHKWTLRWTCFTHCLSKWKGTNVIWIWRKSIWQIPVGKVYGNVLAFIFFWLYL